MKYKTIIETDDFENFEFFEDGNGKYIHGIDAGAVNNEWIALYFTECEQEPKTGHWISFGVQGEMDGGQIVQAFTCSECGTISIFRMRSGNIVNGDICPNCGCRMVEPQERSDKE